MAFGGGGFGSTPFGSGSPAVVPPSPGPVPAPPFLGGISLFSKRAGETQMRIQPVNESVADRQGLVATITVVAGALLTDGDYFTLDDLEARPIKFEYDNNTSVVESRVLRAVSFTALDTAEAVRDATVAAINAAPFFAMRATPVGLNQFELEHPNYGALGKGSATENVAAAGWLLTLDPPDGRFVFCLGDDLLLPPPEHYTLGDIVRIDQTVSIPVSTKYLKAQGRFRQPANLPIRQILPAGTVVSRAERKQIITIQGVNLLDGETFGIDDGVNPIVGFEFDSNSSVVETATLRAVLFTVNDTPTQVRDSMISAINAAPTLNVLATPVLNQAIVALENDVGGPLLVGEAVTHPDFVIVSGFQDISRIRTPSAFFTAGHILRSIFLSGAGVTTGTRRIFEIENATTAVFADAVLPTASGPFVVSGHVKGAHWRFRLLLEGASVLTYEPGRDGGKRRDLDLPDIGFHVSRLSGMRTIAYELELVETPG